MSSGGIRSGQAERDLLIGVDANFLLPGVINIHAFDGHSSFPSGGFAPIRSRDNKTHRDRSGLLRASFASHCGQWLNPII